MYRKTVSKMKKIYLEVIHRFFKEKQNCILRVTPKTYPSY